MQITFLARKSALIYRRGLRQRVASLTIDCNGVSAIRAYGRCVDNPLLFHIRGLPGFDPPGWEARIIRCKNLALYIRDCESLCLSDETVKAVGPFYLVSMPGEVKDPTQGVNV